MLVDEWSEDRVAEELREYDLEVLRTNRSPADEDNHRAVLDAA